MSNCCRSSSIILHQLVTQYHKTLHQNFKKNHHLLSKAHKQKKRHTSSPYGNVVKSSPLMKYTSLKYNQHEASTTSVMKSLVQK
jgi:hypothetical protein